MRETDDADRKTADLAHSYIHIYLLRRYNTDIQIIRHHAPFEDRHLDTTYISVRIWRNHSRHTRSRWRETVKIGKYTGLEVTPMKPVHTLSPDESVLFICSVVFAKENWERPRFWPGARLIITPFIWSMYYRRQYCGRCLLKVDGRT